MRIRTVLIGIAAVLVMAGSALAIFVASFDANRYKPQLVALVQAHTGQTLVVEGDLTLSVWPRIGLSMGAASLSGSDGRRLNASVDSAQVAAALRPLLSGRLLLEAVALRGLTLAAGTQTGNGWRLEAGRLDAAPIADGATGRFTLEGLLRPAGGADTLAIKLESAFLPKLHTRQLTATPLTLTARLGRDAHLSVAGKAELDAARQSATLALTGTLDDRPIALSMQLDRSASLAARWQLTADVLDIDRLQTVLTTARQPDHAGPAQAPASAPPEPAPADSAVHTAGDAGRASPLAVLASIASQGELNAGQLRAGSLTLHALSATVTTGGGRIEIPALDATLSGGRLHATATLASDGHRLKGSLTDLQLGALLKQLGGYNGISGLGSARFDLHGQGHERSAIIGSLGGSLALSVRNGALHGLDLERILDQVQAALGGRLPVEGGPQAGASTPFQSLAADFRLARGIATSDNLEFRADWLHATGRGHLDLPARTLDWLIQTRLTGPGTDASPRGLPARLRGLELPVRLSGSFDALRYRVALDTLAADLARKELERRLTEKLQGKPGGTAQSGGAGRPGDAPATPLDLLKGFLRR